MRHELEGVIAAAGFASGDRVVVGHWRRSPVGPMSDVMWAAPDGRRTLFAPDDGAAEFITAVYGFDRVVVGPVVAAGGERGVRVDLADRRVELTAGAGWRIPFRGRPAWCTRWVEGPVARVAMGVRTYGVSPTGVREWYRADVWRPVVSGRASVQGRDLGALGPVSPACGFGFSEPPSLPSITSVRPLLEGRDTALDAVVADARARRGVRVDP